MRKKAKKPTDWHKGFTKCPNGLILAKGISPAAKIVWLAIRMHCFGKKTSYPALSCLSKETGLTDRHIIRIISELELGGYLLIERHSGRESTYTPLTPMSWVSDTNPDTIVTGLSSPKNPKKSNSVKNTKPKNYNTEVNIGQDTIITGLIDQGPLTPMSRVNNQTPDTHVTTPLTPMSYEEEILIINKKEEKEKVATAPSTSSKRKRQKRSPKVKGHIPTDPVEIRGILDKIDLVKFRKEWGTRIDFEGVWRKFQRTMLEGTPENPNPNPKGYKSARSFPMALQNWCEFREGLDKPKQPQVKPLDERNLDDYVWK